MLAEALVLAVTLVAAVGLWRALSSRALGGKFRMVPGRRWLLGHTEIIHRLKEVHKVAAEWAERYGTCEYYVGGERQLLLTDWKDVEALLRKRPKVIKRTARTREIMDMASPGLFSAEQPNWGVERRLVSAAFSHAAIATYVPRIHEVTKQLMDVLEAKCKGGKAVHIGEVLHLWTEDTIALVGFGQHLNGVANGYSDTSHHVRAVMATMTIRGVIGRFLPYYKIPLIGPYLDGGWVQDMQLNKTMDDVLEQAKRRQGPAVTVLDKFVDKNKEENGIVCDRRLKGNARTMFVAGSDTTATACSWMFYHLAKDAELQADARVEVKNATIDHEGSTLQDIVRALPLLRSLFQEILRVKGIAALLTMENPDAPVVVAGKECAPNEYTFVWPINYFANRKEAEPLVGPEPEVFNARRWLTKDKKNVKPIPDMFNPFGGGSRKCPGRDVALVEVLICASEALKRFDFTLATDEEIEPTFSFGLRPSKPIPIVFKSR